MKSRDTLGLKSALNKVAADDVTSWIIWLGGATLSAALIKLLVDRHNSCAKAIADLLKEENITIDALKGLFDLWHQYNCNRRAGSPSNILRGDARKVRRLIEKIAKLRNCTPEASMLALKHILGNSMTAGMENDLRDAIDRYLNSEDIANAAAIAAALAAIYNSTQCIVSGCVGFVMYIDYLKRKFPGVELAEDILQTIAYLIGAIIAIKLLIVASPGIAGATGLAALLTTYQTALAAELQNAGLAKPGQDVEALVNEIIEEASQEQCQEEQIEQGPPPGDSPTSDTVEIPPSGNFLGDGFDQMKGVD